MKSRKYWKPPYYWTKEKCQKESLKYESKSEFKKHNAGAYNAAKKFKCLDEICSHMIPLGNLYKRCIYVYEFSDNTAYIGLTYNLNERNRRHLKKGVISEYLKITNTYNLKQLTDYLNIEDAKKTEIFFIDNYKKNGWVVLNKHIGGELGTGKIKWSYERCKIEAQKYNYRSDFHDRAGGAHRASRLSGWLDDICSHMKKINKWNKENCQKEALKYKSRYEFNKKSKSAYGSALRNGWLDELCQHMVSIKNPRFFWNYDTCKIESMKYKSRSEFFKKAPYAYEVASKNKWLDDFFKKYQKENKQ